RLRGTLVQGLGAGKRIEAELEPVSLAGNRATALALVFSELFQNALEHGGGSVRVELARRNGEVVLAIADDGAGIAGETAAGTGLSIVQALVREELLEQAGFEVCAEARDRLEAVELAREAEPDVAVLDVKMPRLDGIEAARRILEERPIPIVMLTAYGQDELVSRAVEAGVFGYLV